MLGLVNVSVARMQKLQAPPQTALGGSHRSSFYGRSRNIFLTVEDWNVCNNPTRETTMRGEGGRIEGEKKMTAPNNRLITKEIMVT